MFGEHIGCKGVCLDVLLRMCWFRVQRGFVYKEGPNPHTLSFTLACVLTVFFTYALAFALDAYGSVPQAVQGPPHA